MNIIPVVDLSVNDYPSKIESALRSTGFFHIINHGISLEQLSSFLSLGQKFFKIPVEEKSKISKIHQYDTGYVEIGSENLQEDRPGVLDYKEALDFCVSETHPIYNQNKWPTEQSLLHFQEEVKHVMSLLNNIGDKLVRAFTVSLGGEFCVEQYYKEQPSSLLRFLRYPASIDRIDKDSFVGCGEHSDYGVLTILLQDSTGGLQIEHEGQYIDVDPLPGALLINVGDCMKYLTNRQYKATRHRVINSLPKERYSVVLFFEPNIHMPLNCLQNFSNDQPKQKLAIPENYTFGDHLKYKLTSTYDIQPQIK